MKFINFKIKKFIVQYLGALFGKETQQKLMYMFLYPLTNLWEEYSTFRTNQSYLINITSQVFSIENHLNNLYDNQDRGISLSNGLYFKIQYIAKRVEELPAILMPKRGEATTTEAPYFALKSESSQYSNFIVNVPNSLSNNETQIKAEVNKIKTAGKQFVIKFY